MFSQKNEPDIFRLHVRHLPVIKVVVEIPVAFAEFEGFNELLIFHEVECVEDVLRRRVWWRKV